MKEIEIRTEKIARYLAKQSGMGAGAMELFLGQAYQLIYFGDLEELKRIEDAIEKKQRRRK